MEERLEALETACQGLLGFIETFDMGGDWCQDNYPAIKAARAALAAPAARPPVEVLAWQYLRIARLRAALQFYADVSGYDRGRRARAVLRVDDDAS